MHEGLSREEYHRVMQIYVTVHTKRFLIVGAGWAHNEDHGLHGINAINAKLKALSAEASAALHVALRKIDFSGGQYPKEAAAIIREVHADVTKDYLDISMAGVFHIGAM